MSMEIAIADLESKVGTETHVGPWLTITQEMVNHGFLDGSYRKQRANYADGTTVTVDLDANTYAISE